MNQKLTTLIFVLSLCCLKTLAQTDAASVEFAKNALDAKHNCEDALHFLNMVSDNGKKDPQYLLSMGRVQDCKMNREQAIYYYNKYLESNPDNDSVKIRVAQLKDMGDHNEPATANELRVSKATKQQTGLKHKKRKRNNLYDNYASIGLGYVAGMGNDAPYKQGISLNVSDGFPIIHNKAVIDINIYGDFLFGANQTWYTNAFALTPGTAASPGLGYYDLITIGLLPVIFNKKNSCLTAGAFCGGNLIMLGTPGEASYNAYTYSSPILISFTYGVKANYYLGENFLFFLQLNLNSANNLSVDTYAGTNVTKTNFNTLNIGAAYKFSSFWYW